MDFTNLKWHRAGRISVLSGGTVVDGTNTNWLEADIKAGDMFITTDARPYEVASVNNSTQLMLTEAYKGDTVAGGDYAIVLRVPAVMQAEIANRLVTVLGEWDKRDRSFSETLRLLVAQVEEIGEKAKHSGVLTIPITIPKAGWTEDADDTTGYPWHVDVANDKIEASMTPFLTILPASLGAAGNAGFCPTVETVAGALRVSSKAVPETDILASLALSGAASDVSSLPVATEDTLGLMKIGAGLTSSADGTVSVDRQTVLTGHDLLDEDATEQDLKDILVGDGESGSNTAGAGSGSSSGNGGVLDGDDPVDDDF